MIHKFIFINFYSKYNFRDPYTPSSTSYGYQSNPKVKDVQRQVDDLTNSMRQNMDKVLERDNKLNDMNMRAGKYYFYASTYFYIIIQRIWKFMLETFMQMLLRHVVSFGGKT